jgi:hypothetical protein
VTSAIFPWRSGIGRSVPVGSPLNALFHVPVDESFDAFLVRATKASHLAYAHSEYDCTAPG